MKYVVYCEQWTQETFQPLNKNIYRYDTSVCVFFVKKNFFLHRSHVLLIPISCNRYELMNFLSLEIYKGKLIHKLDIYIFTFVYFFIRNRNG